MKRYGTLLNFAPGVTKEQADNALREFVKANPNLLEKKSIVNWKSLGDYDVDHYRLEEYNDEYGSPIFYIP